MGFFASFLAVIAALLVYGTLVLAVPVRQRRILLRPVKCVVGGFLSLAGFLLNFAHDALSSHKKRNQWDEVVTNVTAFLKKSGLEREWKSVLTSDRLPGNLFLLGRIQDRYYGDRREALLSLQQQNNGQAAELDQSTSLAEALHYMRFATAAYGMEMIASAELEVYGRVLHYPSEPLNIVVARHVQAASPNDVHVADMEVGESVDYLRYLIVIDHDKKKVVLSIRGTFSLTGVLVDLAGFSAPFCGGEAHAGMAHMATRVWNKACPQIIERLRELPSDYGLVVTGHSLGAGVACLITILIYHQQRAISDRQSISDDRSVECFAFAPPPVFAPANAAPEAVKHTIAFCHNRDAVPSMSVDGVRRLMSVLQDIDRSRSKRPFWKNVRFWFTDPVAFFRKTFEGSARRQWKRLDGAPTFVIPARSLIWLQETKNDAEYSVCLLDPQKYALRVLDIHSRLFPDHFTPQYEKALSLLVSPEPPDPLDAFWGRKEKTSLLTVPSESTQMNASSII